MHKQRIWLASIAGFGVLTALFPWVTVMKLAGVSALELPQGWVVPVLFGGAVAVVFLLGPRAEPLDTSGRGIVAVLGTAASGFAVWKYVEISRGKIEIGGEIGAQLKQQGGGLGEEMGRGFLSMFGELLAVGEGLYAALATGLVLAVAAALLYRKR